MQLTFALDDIANVDNGSIETNVAKSTWVPKPRKTQETLGISF
jgi:hypothetical protein